MIKHVAKKILRSIRPGLDEQIADQMEFNRLRRKPPELMWRVCARSPERRTEPTAVSIGHEFFVIGGYQTIDRVLSVVDVFDLSKRRWTDRFTMPADMPQTHQGIACDEARFLYVVGGQLGAQCHPAVSDCFVLDAHTRSWGRLPSLPEPRYSPTLQLWNGRLHAISGAKPDRWTSACNHWSIAVSEGKARESQWREEVPIPRGGPHRASAVLDDTLYVFGGQDGDVKPVAGDPQYTCDWATQLETVYGDSFMKRPGTALWETVSPMLAARTHTGVVTIDRYAVLVGGYEGRHCVSDLIQVYDSRTNRWSIAGRLPYYMKTTAVYHDGWLYVVAGQRSVGSQDLSPGEILNCVWRARFDPALGGR